MEEIKIIDAEEKYIRSFWNTFQSIAGEKKYFSSTRAWPYDITDRFIKDSIKNNIPNIFLIKNEKVVGFAYVSPMCKETACLSVGLLQEMRSRGLGKALLIRLIEKCKSKGYKSIELDVLKNNYRAISLYEDMGFKKIKEIKNGVKLEDKYYDVIQMTM